MNKKLVLIGILLLVGLTLSGCFLPPPPLVMAVVTDTMAILMATTMVTGTLIIVVQGVALAIGDEIKEQG